MRTVSVRIFFSVKWKEKTYKMTTVNNLIKGADSKQQVHWIERLRLVFLKGVKIYVELIKD